MATYQEAKQILQQNNNDDTPSVYDHISELILKLVVERPDNSYEAFEHFSNLVKRDYLSTKEGLERGEINYQKLSDHAKEQELNWTNECSKLLKKSDEEEGEGCQYPDLMSQANVFSWAGINFGTEETYLLFLSIKSLADSLPGDQGALRFWGKITARKGSYYIVQGPTYEQLDIDDMTKQEGTEGTNKYTYWVTKEPSTGIWKKLPHVTQAQILCAQKIRRLFTGDLDADVPSFPPFPGNEKNLLRAQIARITASTSVSPSGYFELEEDTDIPQILPADPELIMERGPLTIDELRELDTWVHHEKGINEIGRCTLLPEPDDEDDENFEQYDELKPLQSLSEEEEDAWSLRLCPGGAASQGSHSVVVARSLAWPGAFGIGRPNDYFNIYVGNGVKHSDAPYTPPSPKPIQEEWKPEEDEEEMEGLKEEEDIVQDPNPPEDESDDEY